MRGGIALGVLTLLCLAVGCGVAVADGAGEELPAESDDYSEEAPYVDAGLDQEVSQGDEVLLDGGGTWDDQGDIVHKEWTIEAPDGRSLQPKCPDCWFTSFKVGQIGEYEVTLTVRDAEGHENQDTLYVEVGKITDAVETSSPSDSSDVSGGGSAGGGGNSGACYMARKVGGSFSGCENHGRFLGYTYNEQGHVEGFKFKDQGWATHQYSEWEFDDEGNIVVPHRTVSNEKGLVWEEAVEGDGYDGRVGEGARRKAAGPNSGRANRGTKSGADGERKLNFAGQGKNPNDFTTDGGGYYRDSGGGLSGGSDADSGDDSNADSGRDWGGSSSSDSPSGGSKDWSVHY